VQNLWRDANRVAHSQLVAILEDRSEAISSQNGKVVLDLQPIIYQLADRLGFKKQVVKAINKGEETGRLKPGFAQLEVADSDQLDTAQTVTKILKGLGWLFTIGTLALFAIAAWLAKGRRWMIVLGYGLGLIAAGLAAIALRSAVKGPIVDSLAKTEDARVPAEHAWDIATSLLHRIASSVIVLESSSWSARSWLRPQTPLSRSARRWRRRYAIDRRSSGRRSQPLRCSR